MRSWRKPIVADGRRRLDNELVARGLARSRSQAADLIGRGLVLVDGKPARKAGAPVSAGAEVKVDAVAAARVSRAGAKLDHALDHFRLDASGRVALDIGAATGGFTQVLLRRGAVRVYAVDVGHGQLAAELRSDSRVVCLEGRDARMLSRADIPEPIEAITVDVSFIALDKVLPEPLSLAAPGAWLVALVKPQFELGRDALGKGGIVRDPAAGEASALNASRWLENRGGWVVQGLVESPLAGRDGNREWLVAAVKAH